MVPVDKYIRKLLFEFDCVIIPDFGGLLTHRVGVRYDESTQLFKPAGKRLAFNEILKIDDGLLAYYLAAGEHISREQATEETRKFVAFLRSDLENQRKAAIDKIGSFSTNYEGKLIFEPDYAQNFNQDWYGLEEISAERLERQPNWLRQESESVQDTDVLVANEHSIVPLNTKRNVRWGWAAAAVLVCAASAASYLFKPNERNLLSSLDPISLVSNIYQSTNEVPVYADKVVAHSAVEVVYFQEIQPEANQDLERPELVFEEDPTVVAGSPVLVGQPVAVQLERKYFLIAGSFQGQKNARKLKAQLQKLGFDEASIIDDKSGKWVKVAANAYETHEEAVHHKAQVDKVIQAESWVFHRK